MISWLKNLLSKIPLDVTLSLFELLLFILLFTAGGVCLVFLRNYLRRRSLQSEIDRIRSKSTRNPNYGKRSSDSPKDSNESSNERTPNQTGILLESVRIKNFKNIADLNLDLTRESVLSGHWTCIAGINGAGKSSILQAICLVLLGADYVTDLGKRRLGRMLRRTPEGTLNAEIEAVVRHEGVSKRLYVPLTLNDQKEGELDQETLRRQPDFQQMRDTWTHLRKQVLVCYGASRNVSDYKDPRHESISRVVEQQMTLFDPLTQIASVDVLLKGGPQSARINETLYRLLKVVLGSEGLAPEHPEKGEKLRFSLHSTAMDVIDLPDGFRSTVAWLADLCAAWHDLPGNKNISPDPTKITGIVMLDEIGLHLHPSLEKALVPQLRKALPNLQFLVSTHSPLVLSGFDRDELVMLDANSDTGTRELDRQVFGLTMDDIYSWLMDTSPASPVMEEMLKEEPHTKESSDLELAVLLYQSKDVNEDKAREIIAEREQQIAKLRGQAKS